MHCQKIQLFLNYSLFLSLKKQTLTTYQSKVSNNQISRNPTLADECNEKRLHKEKLYDKIIFYKIIKHQTKRIANDSNTEHEDMLESTGDLRQINGACRNTRKLH